MNEEYKYHFKKRCSDQGCFMCWHQKTCHVPDADVYPWIIGWKYTYLDLLEKRKDLPPVSDLTRYDIRPWYFDSGLCGGNKMSEVKDGAYVLFSDIEKTVSVLRALRYAMCTAIDEPIYCNEPAIVSEETMKRWIHEIDQALGDKR
jgi:hypothetical protein